MRAAFIVPTLQRSGGIQAVVGQVRLLRERSQIDASLVVCGRDGGASLDVPVLGFGSAAAEDWDVVVSTWWTTWMAAAELRAHRRVLLLQGLDERFYRRFEPFERLGAGAAFAAADDIIAVSQHLAGVAAALRPEARCQVVRVGLDRGVFVPAPRSAGSGPLRILVEGNPGLWLKGVDDALAAVRAMEAPAHVTLVTLDRAAAAGLGVDRVVGDLEADGMAALYGESDVLLKLSRTEGLGLPPLEAAAVGTPSVVTPYGGHADWLQHGFNGVQVGFDDPEGAGAWLDLLASDRSLLRMLGEGALGTADTWPTVEQSADALAAALREIAASAAGDGGEVRRATARALARSLAVGRVTQAGHYDAIAALDHERAQLVAERRLIEDRLQAVLSSRAYQWAVRLRDVLHLLRRPLSRAGRRGLPT